MVKEEDFKALVGRVDRLQFALEGLGLILGGLVHTPIESVASLAYQQTAWLGDKVTDEKLMRWERDENSRANKLVLWQHKEKFEEELEKLTKEVHG